MDLVCDALVLNENVCPESGYTPVNRQSYKTELLKPAPDIAMLVPPLFTPTEGDRELQYVTYLNTELPGRSDRAFKIVTVVAHVSPGHAGAWHTRVMAVTGDTGADMTLTFPQVNLQA